MSPLVVDASVVVETMIGSPIGRRAQNLMLSSDHDLHIPSFAVTEVLSVLRRIDRQEHMSAFSADRYLSALREFPARRWPIDHLSGRVWQLRNNLSAYDATYVALAEVLGATLVTADARLCHRAGSVSACPLALV
ncbi:MAG: type II toxin-antitoxin system VapC family toxin [Propionibacteriaceae bacterium]|nr:type II toxin-antitoxin system VapC family toxin [Propionibacteriaceae bacterium]